MLVQVFIYITVVAPYAPVITVDSNGELTARPAVVDYGDTIILNCTASGGPGNMFRWFKDDMIVANTSILNISSISAADGGMYECVVNNTAGNSTANITIYGKSCLPL